MKASLSGSVAMRRTGGGRVGQTNNRGGAGRRRQAVSFTRGSSCDSFQRVHGYPLPHAPDGIARPFNAPGQPNLAAPAHAGQNADASPVAAHSTGKRKHQHGAPVFDERRLLIAASARL